MEASPPQQPTPALRVLLIAEAANPEWTSVPLVGWSHSRALARLVHAHLVTQVRNRDAILRAGLVEGRDFTAIDSEAVAKWTCYLANLLRGGRGRGWTTGMALSTLSYHYFEKLVWRQFKRRICDGAFDIVHRLTPLSPTIPSLLAAKCRRADVPFVVGPLNGGVPWPRQFGALRRREREWLSYVRGAYRLLPGYRSTLRNAAAVIAGSNDTLCQIPKCYQAKCVYIPENAIDPARFQAYRTHQAALPLKVAFVGRLVPYKGADMLVEAAAPLVRRGAVTVDIIGDGPEMAALRELVRREEVGGGIQLPGWIPHAELQHRLAGADLFGFPSIREFGGGVVLEAMACGLVPVVVNYAGPGELVTERTGFRVPMGSRVQIIERFRAVLSALAAEPGLIDTMSQAAMRRARQQFTWDAKAKQVVEVYKWVMDPASSKPDFPIPIPDLCPADELSLVPLVSDAAAATPAASVH